MKTPFRFFLTAVPLLTLGGCVTPAPPILPDPPKTKYNASIVVVIDNETLDRKLDFRIDFTKFRILPGQILKQTADDEMPLMFTNYGHSTEYREPAQGNPGITVVLTIRDFNFQPKLEAAAKSIVVARAYGPNRQKLFSTAYVETGTNLHSRIALAGAMGDIDGLIQDSTKVAMKRVFGKLRSDLERNLTTAPASAYANTPATTLPLPQPDNRKKADLPKFNSVRVVCSIPQERLIAQSDSVQPLTPNYGSSTSASRSIYPNNPAMQARFDSAVGIGAAVMSGVINEIRTRKAYRSAQKDIELLQRYIGDVDYRRDFCGRLKNAVLSAGWKQVGDVVIDDKGMPEYWEDESFDKLFGTGSEEALLIVNGFYSMQKPDYAIFESVIQASLWHRAERRKAHTGRYAYLSEPMDNQNKRVAVGSWADQGGRLYRAAVKQSIDETLSLMRADLLNPDFPENQVTSEYQFLNFDLSGRVLQKSATRGKRVMILGPGGYYSGPRLTSEGGELESLANTMESIRQNAQAVGP